MVQGIFQCQSILLIWIIVGQDPTVLAVGVGGFGWIILLLYIFSLFFLLLSGRQPEID